MLSKTQFHTELLGKSLKGWPFWAKGPNGKGHPFDAKLIFIGYNPSSIPERPFGHYWDAQTGFNMHVFEKERPIPSPSRAKIFRIVQNTIGAHATYLNTNLIWTPGKRMKYLSKTAAVPGDLLWLLKWVPADVIVITHGKPAREYYAELYRLNSNLPKAIPCIHLSGLGAGKGIRVETEIQKLIWAIKQKLNA